MQRGAVSHRGIHFRRALLWSLLGGLVFDQPHGATDPAPLLPSEVEIDYQARALQPGEAVLLTVTSSAPLQEITATFREKTIRFYPAEGSTVWDGLVGIDLDVRPGLYPLELVLIRRDGGRLPASYPLPVQDKQFPTRTLQVEEEYANPPAAVRERIRRESLQLEAIFAATSPERFWQGNFLPPVSGTATSSFGIRSILNGQPHSPHSGIDFRAEKGTPLRAPNFGRVVLASDLYFSGNSVILDHGLGLYSFLAHLSRIAVSEGDLVSRGQLLGYVGATGRVTGPHLHWTVRLQEARVDPLSLMALPLDESQDCCLP